jgi:hypothetical protein
VAVIGQFLHMPRLLIAIQSTFLQSGPHHWNCGKTCDHLPILTRLDATQEGCRSRMGPTTFKLLGNFRILVVVRCAC